MNCEKIGKFIAELRKEQGITQKELADKLNITGSAVSRWERGCGCPDISLLENLSHALEVSINEILAGERIENLTKDKSDQIIKNSILNYTSFEKTRILRKAIKVVIIAMLEFVIMFYASYIVVGVSANVSDVVTNSELWYPYFYQNIYTLLTVIGMSILIGTLLFIIFKFIEVRLISKHKKDSYQYLFIPCISIIIWEIIYSFTFQTGLEEYIYI